MNDAESRVNKEEEVPTTLQETIIERDLARRVTKVFDGKQSLGTTRFHAKREKISLDQYIGK